jgi:spermidine synthase
LFYGGGQGILTASQKPLRASLGSIAAHQTDPRIQPTLPKVMFADGHIVQRRLVDLLGDVLVMDADLDAFLAAVAREAQRPVDSLVSTDDTLYLEYATPRGNVLPWEIREELLQRLLGFRRIETMKTLYAP